MSGVLVVGRVIRVFNKADSGFSEEFSVDVDELKILQYIFGVDASNPMFDSFEILPEHNFPVEICPGIIFDFGRKLYFLEYA